MPRDIVSPVQDWTGNDPSIREWRISLGENTQHEELRYRTHALRETTMAPNPPINEYDALMRCAPGDQPERTLEDLRDLREAISDAVEQLEPRLKFVFEAINYEGASYGELAARMSISKTYAFKLARQAEAEVRALLHHNPIVKEYLMPESWNTAAREAVTALSPVGAVLDDDVATQLIERKVQRLRDLINSKQLTDGALASAIITIGRGAADMLSNRGLWDIDEIVALLCRKQHDYGHGNILAFGMVGVAVRDSDKVARWLNLAGKQGTAEPAIDALLDMVGYAAIAQMLLNGKFTLELEPF